VKDLGWDTIDGFWNRKVEDWEVFEFTLGERTVVDGIDDSSGVFEGTSLAGTELSTSPTSVDQPTVDIVLLHTLCKHLGVSTGVENDEGLTVTCGESGRGLDNTVLGTGCL